MLTNELTHHLPVQTRAGYHKIWNLNRIIACKQSIIIMVAITIIFLELLSACTPLVYAPGNPKKAATLTDSHFVTRDGITLPVKFWSPEEGRIKAVIIALHGFNDYSNFFEKPGQFLSTHQIASYAYDQRGFGGSPNKGTWAGVDAYTDDLAQFTSLVRDQHPGVPVFLLGESMGGAVVMVAMNSDSAPNADGIILAAPAVWGRKTMPWYQRLTLAIGVRTFPSVKVSGKGFVKVTPSDNIEMLRALSRDPLIIRETRIDALYGLANLMDTALENASSLQTTALFLYGERDEIIPLEPTRMMLQSLPEISKDRQSIAFYEDGYHMILRDLNAEVLLTDIVTWIQNPNQPLASHADKRALQLLAKNT